MQYIYKSTVYESAGQSTTEAKILATVLNAKSFDPSKRNQLYRVGGVVRDEIIGAASKDIDYLVTNVAFDDLKTALTTIADSIVSTDVGESMQVIKAVIDGSDEPYDFAIPRTEVYGGSGSHTDVSTFGDPSLPVESDLMRRDVSMNAIAKNVETGEYIDPFGGISDIKAGVIKAVRDPSERFAEDPLRMMRAIQFANRFGFKIEESTMQAIKSNLELIDKITGERILEELKKAFTKGMYPGNARLIEMLEDSGIGQHLFGLDFKPVKTGQVYGDKFIVNMILLFLNGGNFAKLKPSTEVSQSITLARNLKTGDALKVMFKNEKYLQFMKDSAKSMNDSTLIGKLNSLEGVPLSNKDLAIESEYLMSLGYTDVKLGQLQKALIHAIYEKIVKNNTNELEQFIEGIQ